MKSLQRERFVTAHEIAVRKGYKDLVHILEPKFHHIIPSTSLDKLESKVHHLMLDLAGDKVIPISYSPPPYSRREYKLKPTTFRLQNTPFGSPSYQS